MNIYIFYFFSQIRVLLFLRGYIPEGLRWSLYPQNCDKQERHPVDTELCILPMLGLRGEMMGRLVKGNIGKLAKKNV